MILRVKDFATKVGSGVTPRGGADVYLSEGIPFFRSQNITNEGLLLEDIVFISEEINESMSATKLYPGDVLLNITGASIGRCYYLPENFENGNVNQHVCIIRPNKNVMSSFLYYNLISKIGQNQIILSQNGANREGLTKENICNFSFVIPSIEEQQAIADYLDKKTGEIDEQISLLDQKQKAYAKLKQSLISEVVTRGLNKNVALKDSGIEWIGKIPTHWEVKRLKDYSNIIFGQSPNGSDITEDGEIPFMQGKAEFSEKFPQSVLFCDNCVKHSRVGDILMSIRAPIGNINLSDKVYGIGRGLCSIKPINILQGYLWFYLMFSKPYIESLGTGSTFLAITGTDLYTVNILLPPIEEQKAIADYLDMKTAEINENIALINQKIKAYKRLKQSLIDEVVTGKRKI